MLYLLSVNANVDPNRVQAMLTRTAHSWYRIAPSSWVICAVKPHQTSPWWTDYFIPIIRAHKGTLLVIRVDPTNRFGIMDNRFWDWLSQHSNDAEAVEREEDSEGRHRVEQPTVLRRFWDWLSQHSDDEGP
jgi:hypothetical protein